MIRRYTQFDYPMVCDWYEARGSKSPSEETLSDTGFIADERVAGWLYTTNSNMAMIEGIVSNPQTVPSLRRESLRSLCQHLVEVAYLMGFSNIFGITKHPSIEQICTDMGFKKAEFSVWALAEKD